MEVVKEYTNDTEREQLIITAEGQGMRLKEDACHIDGNFLTFTDEPYSEPEPEPAPRNLEAEIDKLSAIVNSQQTELDAIKTKTADYDDLKARVVTLEGKIATPE